MILIFKKIETQEDMNDLNSDFCHFHDACIVSINYLSGLSVDEENTMHFPTDNQGFSVNIIFHSQMVAKNLELRFTGVRRLYLSALNENYGNEIIEGGVFFVDREINGKQKRLVAWSDELNIDLENINIELNMFEASFIIADQLSYRKLGRH